MSVSLKKWLLPVLLTAMFVLAACGGGNNEEAAEAPAASEPSAQEVLAATLEVAMGDLYYGETPDNIANPPVWTVQSGETVGLTLVNNGGLEHDWAIVKPGTEVPVPFDPAANGDVLLWDAGVVAAGETATKTFTAPEPGEYTVICTVAGHFPSMQGRLVVQ